MTEHRTRATALLALVTALALCALVPAAQAANLNIDDTIDGQITVNHDANWELGVTSNGNPFLGHVPGSTVAPGEGASFSGRWLVDAPGAPDPGTGTIYIVNSCNAIKAIISASWSTEPVGPLYGLATINVSIQSSALGADLGPLPAAFAGLGVPEPAGFVGIQGLFRHPLTAAPVSIPSNLTVQYGAAPDPDEDCDGDGVPNTADVCPATVLPESVPSVRLGVNRFADIDGDGVFDTTSPNGRGPQKAFTVADTGGCSCEQIIAASGLGAGHTKFGCSISAMEDWINGLPR